MAFLPAVILTVGIAVLSLWENPQVPPSIRLSDKILHGLMYTLLAAAWMFPLTRIIRTRAITYLYVFLSVTLYLLVSDALGALLGLLIVFIVSKITNDLSPL